MSSTVLVVKHTGPNPGWLLHQWGHWTITKQNHTVHIQIKSQHLYICTYVINPAQSKPPHLFPTPPPHAQPHFIDDVARSDYLPAAVLDNCNDMTAV